MTRTRAIDGSDPAAARRRVDSLLRSIREGALPRTVRALVRQPSPVYGSRHPSPREKEQVRRELIRRGFLEPARSVAEIFPDRAISRAFERSPGGDAESHHAYPGGLAVHLAVGAENLLSLEAIYRKAYGVRIDPDLAMAAWLLHDHMKPLVLRWERGGRIRRERRIAGSRVHHVLGVANLIALDLPREIVLSVASAHTHPVENEVKVAAILEAACLLAAKDPVAGGLLAPSRKRSRNGDRRVMRPLPLESFLVHLADRDWPLTTFLNRAR